MAVRIMSKEDYKGWKFVRGTVHKINLNNPKGNEMNDPIRDDQMVEAHALDQPKPNTPEGDPLAIPEYLRRETETPQAEGEGTEDNSKTS